MLIWEKESGCLQYLKYSKMGRLLILKCLFDGAAMQLGLEDRSHYLSSANWYKYLITAIVEIT